MGDHVERRPLTHRDRPQIVDAVHVIRMGVCEEHRVHGGNAGGHELQPQLAAHALEPDRDAGVAGMTVRAVALPHGSDTVLGYRVGSIAYLTDAKAVPEPARAQLAGLEVLVLNALLPRPHPLHLSIPEAVAAAQQIGARRTFLTHLTHDTTHAELAARLPPGIAPAYDGLVVEVGAG